MRFRVFLVVVLVASLNFSVCTGGIFQAFSVLAADFSASTYSVEEIPMSYGNIGYLSCTDDKQEKGNTEQAQSPYLGCSDRSECLSQLQFGLERSIVITGKAMLNEFTVTDLPRLFSPMYIPEPRMLARAGPLYESATPLSHSLVKLE